MSISFRCSLLYKICSIISGILSLITILAYLSLKTSMCKGEGALLVLPIYGAAFAINLINILFFVFFNICNCLYI